jgi:HEAT repeat protein
MREQSAFFGFACSGGLLGTGESCHNTPVSSSRFLVGLLKVFGTALSTTAAFGAAPSVSAPASGGQLALSVGVDPSGALRASTCAQAPCDLKPGLTLELPQKLAQRAQMRLYPIGAKRHAVHVRAGDPDSTRTWEAVVTAPAGSGPPKVVFQGSTGLVEGEYGLRYGPMVVVSEAEADGSRHIVVGEQREDTTLCGRPAVLAPQILAPADLELHPAKVQRLPPAERARALRVTARRMAEAPANSTRLLRAVAASSAVGSPQALTDGDPETTWAENRGGDGRGEFVVMQAAPELPIRSFVVVVRPARGSVERGVSPRQFWLATPTSLILVTLPEDAWEHPGSSYEIPLPQAFSTDCVALVTETAYRAERGSQVTFAELVAHSDLDSASPQALAQSLKGGGARAEAAATALRLLGEPGFLAVAGVFHQLDDPGRSVALSVLDAAPCTTSALVYVSALTLGAPGQRHHARTRLERCGEVAGEPLEAALRKGSSKQLALLADELALAAPAKAWRVLLPFFGSRPASERRALRKALAHAASSPSARPAIVAALNDTALPEAVSLDLLRALGPRLTEYAPESERAFLRLARPEASFRTKFLLTEPASGLMPSSTAARDFLARALRWDARPEIRAQAARVMTDPTKFQTELEAALADPAVRVREAAVGSLGGPKGAFAYPGVVRRLAEDPWPLVRRAAAEALGSQPPNPQVDQALIKALEDSSPNVRMATAQALGERRATVAGPSLSDRLADRNEVMSVRQAAARALGRACANTAADDLTRYARMLVDPTAGEDRVLAPTALGALGRLHPPDLERRLAPLLAPGAPVAIRSAARATLNRPRHCSVR